MILARKVIGTAYREGFFAGSLPDVWILFKQNLNSSFIDLRDQFSIDYQHLFQNLSLGIVQVNLPVTNTKDDILQTIVSKKPAPNSLPNDWIFFKQNISSFITNFKNEYPEMQSKLKKKNHY